jgi:hypothetical protein
MISYRVPRSLCLISLGLLLAVASSQRSGVTVFAQDKAGLQRVRSMRILSDKPTVYLSFERVGKRAPLLNGESESGIWLSLHNNTKWAIIVEMSDVPSKEYGDVELYYEVLSGEKTIIDAKCHVCSVNKLSSGRSLVFSLPREYLMDNDRSIRIRFHYEWEQDETGSTSLEPEHYVLFYSSDIPKTRKSSDRK